MEARTLMSVEFFFDKYASVYSAWSWSGAAELSYDSLKISVTCCGPIQSLSSTGPA